MKKKVFRERYYGKAEEVKEEPKKKTTKRGKKKND